MPMHTPYRPRPARPTDLPAVRAVIEAAFQPFVARIGQRPAPMDDNHAAQIAAGQVALIETGGCVAAILVSHAEPDALVIDTLAVAPDQQGRGLARALLGRAEEMAALSGLGAVRLYTNEAMASAIGLYLATGYAETGRATQQGFRRIHFRKDLAGEPPVR